MLTVGISSESGLGSVLVVGFHIKYLFCSRASVDQLDSFLFCTSCRQSACCAADLGGWACLVAHSDSCAASSASFAYFASSVA